MLRASPTVVPPGTGHCGLQWCMGKSTRHKAQHTTRCINTVASSPCKHAQPQQLRASPSPHLESLDFTTIPPDSEQECLTYKSIHANINKPKLYTTNFWSIQKLLYLCTHLSTPRHNCALPDRPVSTTHLSKLAANDHHGLNTRSSAHLSNSVR